MSTIRILLDKYVYTEPANGMVWMDNGIIKHRARLQEKRMVNLKTEWIDIDIVYLESASGGVDTEKEGKALVKESDAEPADIPAAPTEILI